MKDRLLLISFVSILLVFGLLLARKYFEPAPAGPIVIEPGAAVTAGQREVLLYFAAPGGHLEAEGHDINDCEVELECLRSTVLALIAGPVGSLGPVLPRQTQVRQVSVEGDLVVVDFSRDFVNSHPGGSLSELLTVYSLIDTLAVNFPYVRQLRIQVEGQPLETIKGHVDLRSPVSADFRYTRANETLDALPLQLFNDNTERPGLLDSPAEELPPR